ncbi:MAG: hypothetical protein HQK55_18330 [Deltaproteobacteria bacterium]|nr:hypothetical protein [Deltaproteobacteria bacterium]
MPEERESIIKAIMDRLVGSTPSLSPPLPYLDQEGVRHIFQELTGLADPPVRPGDVSPSAATSIGTVGASNQTPIHMLYEAMLPAIERYVPLIRQPDELNWRQHDYARIQGLMQGTHFPDGDLNMEIQFAGIRGLIFYDPAKFSSMFRPLLITDRLFTLYLEVEALVYVQGPLQRNIFYHQIYGDNREHLWAPLVPVVIKTAPATSGTRPGEEIEWTRE